MKLVLDTSALWHRPLAAALVEAAAEGCFADGRLEAILPATAYAERRRQLTRDGRDVARWVEALRDMGVRVEQFGRDEADRVALSPLAEDEWRRHARDALVAAHVHAGRAAVTEDRGPAWRGVPRMSPGEAAEAVCEMVGRGGGHGS